MDRAIRLSELWNWLPAFRAVAETEHLPTAAKLVGLTPSALSRAVTQLEGAVACELFERTGRRLKLVPAGQQLLSAVRDAMRRIDDGLAAMTAGSTATVRIAGDGVWLAGLLPRETTIEIEHVDGDPTRTRDELRRGAIDIAITEVAPDADGLLIERLGSVTQAVYATSSRVAERFAVCATRDEGWPAEIPRVIGFRSTRLSAVVDACRSGHYRAVLPHVIARSHRLRPSASPHLASTPLFMARRPPLTDSPIETVARGIVTRAYSVLRDP